jgi:hypothetical protein
LNGFEGHVLNARCFNTVPDGNHVDLFVTRHLKLALDRTLYRTAKLWGLSVIFEQKPHACDGVCYFALDLMELSRLERGRLQNLAKIGRILEVVFVVFFAAKT